MSNPTSLSPTRSARNEWLTLVAALAVIGMCLFYWYVAERDRVAEVERERLRALAGMVVKDVAVNLIAVNNALNGIIRDRLADDGQVNRSAVALRLAALVEAMPGVRGIVVLDANGQIVAGIPNDLTGRNFSQRAYFTVPRQGGDATTLYLSPPFRSIRGDIIMSATRVIGGGGDFRGVVSAALHPAYFSGLLHAALYAPDLHAALNYSGGGQFVAAGAKAVTVPDLRALATVRPDGVQTDSGMSLELRRSLAAVHAPLRQQASAFLAVYITLALIGGGALAWFQGRRRRFLDIESDRRRELAQAQALSESEARFRTLIEEAPVAVAMARQGHFIYTNRRYNLLHGYDAAEDLTGLPWRAMIAPQSAALLEAQAERLGSDAPVEQRFEAVGLGKGEAQIPVFKSTTRVNLSDGPATLIFVQDISAQKTAELHLLEARDAAQSANRSKADFLANMSHEIRTPLNAILGLAYLLERGNHDGATRATLGKIRSAGRSLLGIINDILDVSKIEAGAMVLEHAWFSMQDVIDTIADSMGVAVADKDIAVLVRPLPAAVGSVMGDALRLEQLLLNLTSNAIKFTERGRVELSVQVRQSADGKAELLFQVSDTGIGIAPEQQLSIFSPFTQADNSTTRRFGGSGLGLTICKQIVDLMGGQIGVQSAPGIGSVFWFAAPLPMRAAAEDYSSPDMVALEVALAVSGGPSQSTIEDTARTFGWQTRCFDSDSALLDGICHRPDPHLPDVVILDWLADDDGSMAAARAIRDCVPADRCPVILLISAYRAAAFEQRAERASIDAVLVKPVTASTLYNAVIEARRRRLGNEGMAPGAVVKQAKAMLSGLRILVVDDSEINRDVAQQILANEGAAVILADNGRAAVDRMLAGPADIDLILMDVQMPVMDGIEATRILRSMAQFADLPIIALTAGAFISQQEAAHSAGMTHFVAKPFDVPATVELIRRLTGRRGGPDVVPMEVPRRASEGGAGPIDTAQALRLWGNLAQHERYLAKFFSSFHHAVSLIRADAGIGNTQAAAAEAHKLAGAAANVALPGVHAAAQQLEMALRHCLDHAALLDALESAMQGARAAASLTAAPAVPVLQTAPAPYATVAPLLAALSSAVQEGRPAAADIILDELETLLPVVMVAPIRDSIDNFDFASAAVLARALSVQLQFSPEP